MPTLLEYINQLQREHRFRIKMVFPPSDKQLETIERHLKKYDALEVGRPEKLMLQAIPMDFPQHGGHEIVIVDIVTRLPISPHMLEAELRTLLGAAEGTLKVFGRDEPVQKEIEKEPNNSPYEVKTGEDYRANEANTAKADDASGDKFNQSMLKDLDTANKERKDSIRKPFTKTTSGPSFDETKDGQTSPIGTRKQTIPNPRKGAK